MRRVVKILLISFILGLGACGPSSQEACRELAAAKNVAECTKDSSDHSFCKGSPVYEMRLIKLRQNCDSIPNDLP